MPHADCIFCTFYIEQKLNIVYCLFSDIFLTINILFVSETVNSTAISFVLALTAQYKQWFLVCMLTMMSLLISVIFLL